MSSHKPGTKKNPSDLFLAWDQIAAIKFKRAGNAQQVLRVRQEGSKARFSSYTFFRPEKIARLIADRTGPTPKVAVPLIARVFRHPELLVWSQKGTRNSAAALKKTKSGTRKESLRLAAG